MFEKSLKLEPILTLNNAATKQKVVPFLVPKKTYLSPAYIHTNITYPVCISMRGHKSSKTVNEVATKLTTEKGSFRDEISTYRYKISSSLSYHFKFFKLPPKKKTLYLQNSNPITVFRRCVKTIKPNKLYIQVIVSKKRIHTCVSTDFT